MTTPTPELAASDHVRARLGALATQVRDTGQTVTITAHGEPDGALIHLDTLTAVGLTLAGAWGVREAREDWATARRCAAAHGPQAITHRERIAAVLVDQDTAAAIARGLPPLVFDELSFDGDAVLADGVPIPPGRYAAPGGGVLIVADTTAPYDQEH